MSDEPQDDGESDDPAEQLPADDRGLGLTEEFARIEAEIDAEPRSLGGPRRSR